MAGINVVKLTASGIVKILPLLSECRDDAEMALSVDGDQLIITNRKKLASQVASWARSHGFILEYNGYKDDLVSIIFDVYADKLLIEQPEPPKPPSPPEPPQPPGREPQGRKNKDIDPDALLKFVDDNFVSNKDMEDVMKRIEGKHVSTDELKKILQDMQAAVK